MKAPARARRLPKVANRGCKEGFRGDGGPPRCESRATGRCLGETPEWAPPCPPLKQGCRASREEKCPDGGQVVPREAHGVLRRAAAQAQRGAVVFVVRMRAGPVHFPDFRE